MKAIVILGAAVWRDGPSPTLRRRTGHAIALWQAGLAEIVVPCGGLGLHPPTEAAAMTGMLLAAGIPSAAIHPEDRSTTTLENLLFARAILKAHEVTSIIIVTDLTHAPRAALVARHLGLRARVSSPSLRQAHRPTVLRQAAREALAYPLYALRLTWRRRRSDRTD